MSLYKGNNLISGAIPNSANQSLSNLNSAGQDKFDEKVNKSGDTMTGGLTVQDNHIVIQSPEAWDGTPSTQIDTGVKFNNNNGDMLGYVNCVYATNGARIARLNTRNADGSANTFIEVGYNSSGIAYCSFPATKCVDGQWITASDTLANNVTFAASAKKDYSVSSILPNDNYIYEVKLSIWVQSGGTSGDSSYFAVTSDIITNGNNYVAGVLTRTNSQIVAFSSFDLPVGNGRTIYVANNGASTGTLKYLRLIAYRRIGTNT